MLRQLSADCSEAAAAWCRQEQDRLILDAMYAGHHVRYSGSVSLQEGRRLAERAVRYLGAAVCNLMAVVNPDAVVFGGGAIRSPGMLEQVSAYTAAHCVGETYKSLRYIGLSALNPAETGMIGAAALAGFGLSGSMRARP